MYARLLLLSLSVLSLGVIWLRDYIEVFREKAFEMQSHAPTCTC